MAQAFAELSVAQIQAGLTAKEFSAKEVAENSLARIVSADRAVHAFLETTEEAALAAAARVDAAIAAGDIAQAGPLAGVPVAFKDNMNLEGTHTTCSSRMLENYVSPYTATCVSKIIEAGGIPLGKLNMDEFAFGSSTETSAFGCTFNPWDLERVPGGSSGGSSAAVAAGLATLTLGSDTGGSIRQPGSFCGTVAVKPTYGVVSRYGVVAFGSSLDQVGPLARNSCHECSCWPRSARLHQPAGNHRFHGESCRRRFGHAHRRCSCLYGSRGFGSRGSCQG